VAQRLTDYMGVDIHGGLRRNSWVDDCPLDYGVQQRQIAAHNHSSFATAITAQRVAEQNARRQEEMSYIGLLGQIGRNTDRICADDKTILRPPKTGLDLLRQEMEEWCGNALN